MKRYIFYFFLLHFFLLFPLDLGNSSELISFQKSVKTGTIFNPKLSEISGIFFSWKNSQVLWVVNDSGNPPELYAVSTDGQLLNAFSVEGAKNVDWEDLSGYRFEGEELLVIGDIGDNKARREFCTLYAVKEPDATSSEKKQSLEVTWEMRFQYADGPRDCEALAVDEANQKIYLLSKREKYPTLYELPLSFMPGDTMYIATPVAQIRTIPPPTQAELKEKHGKNWSQPTSMEISLDGKTLVILTYKNAYLFRRNLSQAWDEVFLSPSEILHLPLPNTGELIQREALCIDHETESIIVTTEQIPAPIYIMAPKIIP